MMVNTKLSYAVKFTITSIIIGSILGLVGASAAHYFRVGIVLISDGFSQIISTSYGFFYYVFTLTVAALIVHQVKKLNTGKPFQGIADSIFYAHRPDNEADIKSGILSTLAAFISAGGGASVGQYGPLVHFGSTIGSWLKEKLPFQLSLDLYIGGGVAAAISSGFGAPLAGMVFAHEAIMRHYSHKAVLSIAIASCVAFGLSTAVWGESLIFPISKVEFDFLTILYVSFIAGPVFGIVAIIFMNSLIFFNKVSVKFFSSVLLRYAIAIISLSAIGHFVPEVMGLGTGTVLGAVSGEYVLYFALIILIGKILATSISLGLGFFGGVFSPALLVGASAGAVVAELFVVVGFLEKFEPALVVSGMAAVTGAVIGAPLCMVVIVMELTSSYIYALASLVGLTLSVSLSHILFGASYFDRQLGDRGIDISTGRSGMFLMEKRASDYASFDYIQLQREDLVKDASRLMSEQNKNEVIVLDTNGQFYGKIELHSLIGKSANSKIEKFVDTNCVTIKHDASLQQAMEAAANFVGEAIPIINRETNQVISVITEGAIFDAYLTVQDTVIDMEKR
jgi:CIC family chloride channel protein